ncbi:unnamed protein product [Closterium sp. Naga37s-1]|nr:unnamed protein product [Closterium sp. Naga37s-1]
MNRRKAAAKGDLAKLIWCFIGVVGTLIIYGIGQERIMKFPYGDRDEDSEYFQHSLFIVLCNRLMTCAVAVIVHLVTGASLALVAPIYAYGAVSLSNVISSGCQYEALKYVSFPLQTIAKSSRMVPVLIWGTIISRKQYKPREYIIAITIILGSCLFFLNVTARTSVKSTFSGLLLMLGYLGFDGFTNTFQDKLFEGYDMPAANQVLYITLCSSVISLLGLRQDLSAAIAFIMRHPDCALHIAVLSVAATISQFFISYTIKTFGALTFATVMTTRQLLSIVLSSTVYGPPLSSTQQVGTVKPPASLSSSLISALSHCSPHCTNLCQIAVFSALPRKHVILNHQKHPPASATALSRSGVQPEQQQFGDVSNMPIPLPPFTTLHQVVVFGALYYKNDLITLCNYTLHLCTPPHTPSSGGGVRCSILQELCEWGQGSGKARSCNHPAL